MFSTRAACATWTVERDEVFFQLVHSLFSPAWLLAAGVLLASYDDTDDRAGAGVQQAYRHRR